MKELLEYIVKAIVNNPTEVVVVEKESVDFPGLMILTVTVAEPDRGVLIGKKGRTINSIRDLVTIAAIRANKRVRVVVDETNNAEPFNNNTISEEVKADQNVEDTLDL